MANFVIEPTLSKFCVKKLNQNLSKKIKRHLQLSRDPRCIFKNSDRRRPYVLQSLRSLGCCRNRMQQMGYLFTGKIWILQVLAHLEPYLQIQRNLIKELTSMTPQTNNTRRKLGVSAFQWL